MNWISEYFYIGKNKIHLHRSENNKETIILLHGAMDNGLCWIPIAKKLSKNYFVIMPDARGHGLTKSEDEDWSYAAMAMDVKNIIEKLQLNQIHIIGHSMGANVGAIVAQKYPNVVKKLILEDPAFSIEEFSWIKKKIYFSLVKIFLKFFLKGNVEELYEKGKKRNPTWVEEEMEPWAVSKMQFKNQDPKKIQKALSNEFDWKETIENIKCPFLLITSEKGLGKDNFAKKVIKLNTNSQWVKIMDAGHNIRRENPKDYLIAIQKFLKE
ncbi:MAG: alpha/beta hydrolase [Candidatus Lokiarchaeota archaeon]